MVRMRLLGATVVPVESGSRTLKDAMNEALRDWVTNVRDTFYCIGSVAGPAPYPAMVRDFQAVIGDETIAQVRERYGHLPDEVVACVGGGSNAMGIFHAFRDLASVRLTGVEAAGEGLDGRHGAPLAKGTPGVLHGSYSYLLQDAWGQVAEAHSISAGLDYPGVGPEHSWLKDSGRAAYAAATDDEALAAFRTLSRARGHHPGAGERPRRGLRAARAVGRRAHRAVAVPDRQVHDPGRGRVRPRRPRASPAATSSSSTSPAAATRTCTRPAQLGVWMSGHYGGPLVYAGRGGVMSVRKLPHPPEGREPKPPAPEETAAGDRPARRHGRRDPGAAARPRAAPERARSARRARGARRSSPTSPAVTRRSRRATALDRDAHRRRRRHRRARRPVLRPHRRRPRGAAVHARRPHGRSHAGRRPRAWPRRTAPARRSCCSRT